MAVEHLTAAPEQPPARRKPPDAGPQPVPGSIAAVHQLQRAAGNQAAVRLLGSAPRRAVQRLVFWDESATPNTVQAITLDRLGGTAGGNHSTSFQLFIETVQNAVIGAQYDTAVNRLMALAKDVKDLPGYIGTSKQKKLFEKFEDTYDDAAKVANTSTNISYSLETLAEAYVKLRNGIDLNYLESGEGDVGPWGERENLAAASKGHQDVDWDNIATALAAKKPTKKDKEQVEAFDAFIEAAANLLDTRNVAPPSDKDEKKAWIKRWKRIIQQHVATVIAAHPGVDAAADTVIEHLVPKLGAEIGMPVSDRKAIVTLMSGSQEGWSNIGAAA